MRLLLPWVTVLALSTLGCQEGLNADPTAPSSPPASVTANPTIVAIGDVVRAQVTIDDVPCDFGFYCKYFEVAAPGGGTLEVGLTHEPGRIHASPIDMWITGAGGSPSWMDRYDPKTDESYARMPAIAGTTYSVGVVSYEIPGVPFQLRFSLLP